MSYKFYISEPKVIEGSGLTYEVIDINKIKITVPGNYSQKIGDQISIGGVLYNVTSAEYFQTLLGNELTNDPTFTTGGLWRDTFNNPISFTGGIVDMDALPSKQLRSYDIFEIGKTYRIDVTIDSMVSPGVAVSPGGNVINSAGVYSFDVTAFTARLTLSSNIGSFSILSYSSAKEILGTDTTVVTLDTTSLMIGQLNEFFLVDPWTEVVEPIGFDDFEYNLIKSQQYVGIENVYSEVDLTWEHPHSKPFIDEYEKNYFDGYHRFKIVDDCEGTELIGILNYMFYSQDGKSVSIRMEQDGFDRKFKNRLDTPINLESGIGIDGNSIDVLPETIRVHQKEFIQLGKFVLSDSFIETQPQTVSEYLPIPVTPTVTEIPGEYNPGGFLILPPFDANRYVHFATNSAGNFSFKIRVKGNQVTNNYSVPTQDRFCSIDVYVTGPNGEFTGTLGVDYFRYNLQGGKLVNYFFDETIELDLFLNNGYGIICVLLYTFPSGIFGEFTFANTTFELASIDVNAILDFPASVCKGLDIYDAFRVSAEAITGQSDIFRSDFLQTGCLSNILITNGYNIRRLLQKDNTLYPVYASFSDLYNAANCISPIGLRIEQEGDKRVIRVESIEYFYQEENIIAFTDVETFKRLPAIDFLYNEIEIGYTNYQDESLNGIDEFNGRQSYALPVNNIKKKVNAVSEYIASGYIIEAGRRLQYTTAPSQDWAYDSNNFLICKNRVPVTTDLYGNGMATYPVGFVTERNELFPTVNNYYSPETSYNLRISPKRNLVNWYRVISNANDTFRFQSGNANIELETEEASDCNKFFSILVENSDLDKNGVAFNEPLFAQSVIDFEYPITLRQFNDIVENANKKLIITYCDILFYGFIISAKFKPETPNGSVGFFRILEAAKCRPGSHSSAFSSAYNIGDCEVIDLGNSFSDGFSDGFDI